MSDLKNVERVLVSDLEVVLLQQRVVLQELLLLLLTQVLLLNDLIVVKMPVLLVVIVHQERYFGLKPHPHSNSESITTRRTKTYEDRTPRMIQNYRLVLTFRFSSSASSSAVSCSSPFLLFFDFLTFWAVPVSHEGSGSNTNTNTERTLEGREYEEQLGLTSSTSQLFREEGVVEVDVRRKFVVADRGLVLDLGFLRKTKRLLYCPT